MAMRFAGFGVGGTDEARGRGGCEAGLGRSNLCDLFSRQYCIYTLVITDDDRQTIFTSGELFY